MLSKSLGKKVKNFTKKVIAMSLIAATVFSTKLPVNAAGAAGTNTTSETDQNLYVQYFHVEHPIKNDEGETVLGSGTCAIVKKADSNGIYHYMLIDTGVGKQALNKVQAWIVKEHQDNGSFKFDYVIISHYDSDHVKNLGEILKFTKNNVTYDIPVDQFIARKYSKTTMDEMVKRSVLNFKNEQKESCFTYYKNYLDFANLVAEKNGIEMSSDIAINQTSLDAVKKDKKGKKVYNSNKEYEQIKEIANLTKEIANPDGTGKQTILAWKNPVKTKSGDYSFKFPIGKDSDNKDIGNVTVRFYSLNNDASYIPLKYKSGKNKGKYVVSSYSEAVNDDSIPFKITYKKSSFWFLNDIKKEALLDLIAEKAYGKKQERTTEADFKNSVVLLPHHGMQADTIADAVKSKFKAKLKSAKLFVRSVSKHHADIYTDTQTLKAKKIKKEKKHKCKFMDLVKSLKKKVLNTYDYDVDGITISTSGNGFYTDNSNK